MTEKNKIDDQLISDLVRSVTYRIPETVEAKVTAAMYKKKKAIRFPRTFVWYPASVVLAMLIIAAVFVFQPFSTDTPAAPITEIKTELELPGKNIKILWVQKNDFKLRR
ncbi:MAG: hypothetical protein GY950_06375 [bacterium]|nr:hypothetical protein [bacterium]